MPPVAVVTGAPSWLGSRLVQCLTDGMADVPSLRDYKAGRPIHCLVRADAAARNGGPLPSDVRPDVRPDVRQVRGDLSDAESLHALLDGCAAGTVFHCAGIIHPHLTVHDLYRINVEGTRNLIEAAQHAGVRRFIYVSSNAPFGFNRAQSDAFTELSPSRPYRNYGRSKMLAEQVVSAVETVERLLDILVAAREAMLQGTPAPSLLLAR